MQDGNSSWIFTMESSHTALWNAMLSIQLSNQQLFSTPCCPSRALQRMMSRCMVQDRLAQQALGSNKTDSWAVIDENDASTTLLVCRLIAFRIAVAKKLPCESQWVKWKQNWNFRSFKIRKVEALRHFDRLPTAPAMSDGDVCGQMADFLILWLNLVHCGPCLLCH